MKKNPLFIFALSMLLLLPGYARAEVAIFAGGCFWCLEEEFEKNLMIDVENGYSGGNSKNPTFELVNSNNTNHRQVVKIDFKNTNFNYQQIVSLFLHKIDPTDDGGQACERGLSFKPAIFYIDEAQKKAAEMEIARLENKTGMKFKVDIIKFKKFYPAEDHNQDYYKKDAVSYNYYRLNCGRDQKIKNIWKK